nr:HEAT repeat domain-containing protein [Gemmatimonadales bacterium]
MSTTSELPTVALRIAALDALIEGEEREAAILAALEDAQPAVRERAIRLAARHLEPAVLGELVADDANAVRRNSAIAALERQGPYAVPQLQVMLRLDDLDVVMFALQVLARIGDPAPTAAILPLLRHPDLNVAQSAIEALGQLRSREAVPALLELLQGELWLQLAAIDALGAIGDARAVGPLVDLVPDSVVAEPALEALQRLAAATLDPIERARVLCQAAEIAKLQDWNVAQQLFERARADDPDLI